MSTKRKTPTRPLKTKPGSKKTKPAAKKTKPAARTSWASFDRAAKRAISGFRVVSLDDANTELTENGLSMPADLVRLAASIDDGARIDLAKLGGGTTQELFSVAGLIDANHREEGGFGVRIASGEVPEGLIMFGYGATQLIYDTAGDLGAVGSIWTCQDQDVSDATKLADSLEALLERATTPVIEEKEPPPPPDTKLMPTPSPFTEPREQSRLFTKSTTAPVGWFLLRRGTELWFRESAGELWAFELTTAKWSRLTNLPAGFERPELIELRDGSALLFAQDYPSMVHRCMRGDGRTAWVTAAGLPKGAAESAYGLGRLPDGRVLVAGGSYGPPTASCLYDPEADRWSAGPALPEAASFRRSLAASNGPHFLSWSALRYLPRVFSLDGADRWQIARSPESASQFVTLALSDGRHALVLTEKRHAACLIYDPVARTLSPLPELPETESTDAVVELAAGVIGAVRVFPSTKREFLAILDISGDSWRAGPLLPAGFTVCHLERHHDRVFLFCLPVVSGSNSPAREVSVFVASAAALARA